MADRTPFARMIRRRLYYPVEALAAVFAYGLFAVLPPDAASAVGGRLLRAVGPLLPAHRRAMRSLARAMPELSPAEIRSTIGGMWDNLGRVLGEFPHIDAISRDAGNGRIAVAGLEHVADLRESRTAAILVSAHLANWEAGALALAGIGLPCALVYRTQNNPYIERLVHRFRRYDADDRVPKGAAGARKAIEVLRAGRKLAILVDQKMNDGIAVPLFGRAAMTAPAAAQLGLRFHCPVVPVQIERTGGCHFRITFHPPLRLAETGDRQADVRAAMVEVNGMLEQWIRARPDQWLWAHRRWPED